jgi:hypothetical protein
MLLVMKRLIDRIFGFDPTVMTLGQIRASNGRLTIHCRDCSTTNLLDPKSLPYKDNMEIIVMVGFLSCPSCKAFNSGEEHQTVSIEVCE